MSEEVGRGLNERMPSRFYQCTAVQKCGLRFPISPGDPAVECCPRCGGAVEVVAETAVVPLAESGGVQVGPERTLAPSRISLLLDNWRSVFNVGAAFRTADGAGLSHLYLCGITASPASQPKVAKTALGAERAVAWSYHADAVGLARTLQEQGHTLWVLERTATSDVLFDINLDSFTQPIVLAAGNEVAGVDPGLLACADRVIHLPMLGRKESLNVAIALSVASYWLRAFEISPVVS